VSQRGLLQNNWPIKKNPHCEPSELIIIPNNILEESESYGHDMSCPNGDYFIQNDRYFNFHNTDYFRNFSIAKSLKRMKNRKHIRLRNFDYSSQAWYFITICTKNRRHTLGAIENGQMHLSPIGKQAYLYWNEIPTHFPHIELGEFIIMPNHIHGIIGIVNKPSSTVPMRHVVSQREEINTKTLSQGSHGVSQRISKLDKTNQFGKTIAGSLSAIIGQFKSTLTRWSRKNGHQDFAWQARFHDHIIRTDGAFQRISNYIKNNPSNWQKDKFISR